MVELSYPVRCYGNVLSVDLDNFYGTDHPPYYTYNLAQLTIITEYMYMYSVSQQAWLSGISLLYRA